MSGLPVSHAVVIFLKAVYQQRTQVQAEMPAGAAGIMLVGYIVADPAWAESGTLLQSIREHCSARLPAAAVPAAFLVLSELPLSAGGKVMRGGLPPPGLMDSTPPHLPDSSQQSDAVHAAKRSRLCDDPHQGGRRSGGQQEGWETRAMRAFVTVLGAPKLEPTSDFMSSGGDSLAAVEVAEMLGIEPQLLAAFPTVRKLAQYLSGYAVMGATVTAGHLGGHDHHTVHASGGQPCRLQPLTFGHNFEVLSATALPSVPGPNPMHGGVVVYKGGISVRVRTVQHAAAVSPSDRPADAADGSGSSCSCAKGQSRNSTAAPLPAAVTEPAPAPALAGTCLWRVHMKECVDASPVLLVQGSFLCACD